MSECLLFISNQTSYISKQKNNSGSTKITPPKSQNTGVMYYSVRVTEGPGYNNNNHFHSLSCKDYLISIEVIRVFKWNQQQRCFVTGFAPVVVSFNLHNETSC